MKRREILAAGALATAATVACSKKESVAAAPKKSDVERFSPKSLLPAFAIKDGHVVKNPEQRLAYSKCWGCFNVCGARVSVDKKTDRVLCVEGNPYALTNRASKPLGRDVSVEESLVAMETQGADTATLCGRGNAAIDANQSTDSRLATGCVDQFNIIVHKVFHDSSPSFS